MEEAICPSYNSCYLIKEEHSIVNNADRISYINKYCKAGEEKWSKCKRLQTKNALNFCPDFVLPDTLLTPDEIIDKFDSENLN